MVEAAVVVSLLVVLLVDHLAELQEVVADFLVEAAVVDFLVVAVVADFLVVAVVADFLADLLVVVVVLLCLFLHLLQLPHLLHLLHHIGGLTQIHFAEIHEEGGTEGYDWLISLTSK